MDLLIQDSSIDMFGHVEQPELQLSDYQFNCESHQREAVFLTTEQNENNVFKCPMCISESDSSTITLVPLSQILESSNETVFRNFPRLDSESFKGVQSYFQESSIQIKTYREQIDQYFQEIRENINTMFEKRKREILEKTEKITVLKTELFKEYSRLTRKQQIKELILDSTKDFKDKSTQIKAIVAEVLSDSQKITELLKLTLDSQRKIEYSLDFSSANSITDTYLQFFEQVNFINIHEHSSKNSKGPEKDLNEETIENDAQQQTNNFINQIEKFNNKLIENLMHLKMGRNAEVLIKNCMKFITQIPENLEELNGEEIQMTIDFMKELVRIKRENKFEIISNSIQKGESKSSTNDLNFLQVDQIMEIITNQANFCSKEYVEDLSCVLNSISGVLRLFRVRDPEVGQEKRRELQKILKNKHLKVSDVAKGVDRVIQEKQNTEQVDNLSIIEQIMSRMMEASLGSSSSSSIHTSKNSNMKVDSQLSGEIIKSVSSMAQTPFFTGFSRTNYCRSNEVGIAMTEKEISLTMTPGKAGQVVSDKLANEKAYLVRVSFNRPYGDHLTQGSGFMIGLIPDSRIDTANVLSDDHSAGFRSYLNFGASIVKKGNRLSSEEVRRVTESLEFRWCVNRKLFFIADQAYKNINQGNPNYFNPKVTYRFGINFHGLPDSNWKVTITEFTEIDPELVTKFG